MRSENNDPFRSDLSTMISTEHYTNRETVTRTENVTRTGNIYWPNRKH